MKLLGLMRHAKSDWGQSDQRDFDRGLNDRGRRGGKLVGEHIREHGLKWDHIVASPAERVVQTLAQAMPDADIAYDKRLYLASSDTITEVAAEVGGEAHAVLIVGHNPGLQDTVLSLVAPGQENDLFEEAKVKFPTASFAVIELPINRWTDLKPETGRLAHLARPRDLDPALGPQED